MSPDSREDQEKFTTLLSQLELFIEQQKDINRELRKSGRGDSSWTGLIDKLAVAAFLAALGGLIAWGRLTNTVDTHIKEPAHQEQTRENKDSMVWRHSFDKRLTILERECFGDH